MTLDISRINGDPAFEIGVAYFDPIDETLKEIGQDSGYILGADPYSSVIHKLYLITGTTHRMTRIRLRLEKQPEIEELFDVKVQPGSGLPDMDSYGRLPNYNTLVIEGPITPNSVIPFNIMVKANSDIRNLSSLPVSIDYDYL